MKVASWISWDDPTLVKFKYWIYIEFKLIRLFFAVSAVCDLAVSSTARLTGPTTPFSILYPKSDILAKVRTEYWSDPKWMNVNLTAIGMNWYMALVWWLRGKTFDQMIGLNLTETNIFRNQLVTKTNHSRHDEESTVLEIPELTNGIKGKSVSPCFVVRSGQKHVFQFNESFQNMIIHQLWIYTTSNWIFTNMIHLKLICSRRVR